MTQIKKFLCLGALLIVTLTSTALEDETGDAKWCRCKKDLHGWNACLAGNLISFRPICQQGGGDCQQSNMNCGGDNPLPKTPGPTQPGPNDPILA